MAKSSLGSKGFISAYGLPSQSLVKESQGWNLTAGTEQKPWEKMACWLALCGALNLLFLYIPSAQAIDSGLGWAGPSHINH